MKVFPRLGFGVVVAALCSAQAMAAPALQLQFPGASESTGQHADALASFRLAIGPFAKGAVASLLTEGPLDQNAWRITAPQISTLGLMQSLRDQITAAGFQVLFECETEACGGFDFRYGTDLLPEPEMHVDLGDFRYLAAKRQGAEDGYLSLMVSRSPQNGYVQLTRIGGGAVEAVPTNAIPAAEAVAEPTVAPNSPPPDLTGFDTGLSLGKPLVLEDLVFGSGSAELQKGDYASLRGLADWLKNNPDKTVILVGHTDASGGLSANVALSKKRAQSVRQTLLANFNIPGAQIAADGVGPLAPRESNLSQEGRQKNRRVEVLTTPTP